MRDRYKRSKQHHRLVESHWDAEDEFINLSIPTKPERLSQSATTPPAFIKLVIFSLLIAAITKLVFERFKNGRKRDRKVMSRRTKRRQPQSSSAPTSSPLKRTKLLSKSNTTVMKEIAKSLFVVEAKEEPVVREPPLVKEALSVDGVKKEEASNQKVESISTNLPESATEYLPTKEASLVYKEEESYVIINSSNKQQQQDIVKEALKLAEQVKVASEIFEKQGLDPKSAHDFVLRRHLSGLQERSRRDYENQKLAVECQMRSVELEQTERRHRESISTQRRDPNGVPKCLAARDRVVEYAANAVAYLMLALAIDRLCQSGMDTIRSELFCECQNQVSWNSMICAFNPYICTVTSSCWRSCVAQWGLRIALGLGMWFFFGLRLRHTLPLVVGFSVLWKQLQLIWYFIVTCLCVAAMMYAMIMYRSQLVHGRLKSRSGQKKELVDEYLLECDHVKMGITAVLAVLFLAFQYVEQGLLFNVMLTGEIDGFVDMT